MLKQAAEKNIYHALINAELTEYLRDHREAFDLIVSADTLVYFGDLTDVIAAAARACVPMGSSSSRWSTPPATLLMPPTVGTAWPLQPRPNLCRATAHRSGIAADDCAGRVRMEAGVPVAGLVVRATKVAAS